MFTVRSLIYASPGPGGLQVQLSGLLTAWRTICFCTAHYLYIGAISGERQVAKQSVLRNTTFTVNDHCPTVTAVSTAEKHMQLEICLRNNSLKSYFHLKFLCIDTDPDYRLNPKANNTCTYT